MTKTKSTKSALMLSALAILLCVSMLVGSTFAWFTDSVASNNNIIKSGNLDAELYWSTDAKTWNKVDENTNVFTNQLWEPGHTEVVYLKVVNEGSLAFKYNFGINVVSETAGINVDDAPFKLSDYIQFGIIEDVAAAYADRDQAVADVTDAKIISAGYSKAASLESKQEKYLAMVVYMPQSVGNAANYKTGTEAPVIKLGINLNATQYTHESDSFDEFYDGAATWQGGIDYSWYDENATELTIGSAEQLAGLAAIVNGTAERPFAPFAATATNLSDSFAGKTVKLTSDINLANINWTPIGSEATPFMGTFDGQGHTIYNLYINAPNTDCVGLFGFIGKTTIKNFNIRNVEVRGLQRVAAVVGGTKPSAVIDNVHVSGNIDIFADKNYAAGIVTYGYVNVKNSSVIADAKGTIGSTGSMVGGICGWRGEGNLVITNCHVKNIDMTGYASIGGLAALIHYDNVISGCSVENVNLTKTRADGWGSIGALSGNWGGVDKAGKAVYTVTDNTIKNVILNGTAIKIFSDIYGSKYSTPEAEMPLVESGNTFENIKSNLTQVAAISTVADLKNALANGGEYALSADIALDEKLTVAKGIDVVIHMNGKKITGTLTGTSNQDLFLVKGSLTLDNGTVELTVTEDQDWNAMSAIFDITDGGVVNLDKVAVDNKGGTDMAFCVHLNNWGEVTLNAKDSTFKSPYVGIRAFNSGYDMNNITLDGCDVLTGGGCFWVHNYTAADFGHSAEKAAAAATRLNVTFTNSTFARTNGSKSLFRYGFTDAEYYDTEGNLVVVNADALQNAVNKGFTKILIDADITGDVTVTQQPDVKITIDGDGNTFAGVLTVDGKSATYLTAGLTIKNVVFKADSISADACIQLGNGDNATRYTCNVTVEGCTFDVPGAVGVKSYTGGDKNLIITGCTATANAHSLAQLAGVDGVVVKECEIYSKNGLNFNNSTNVTVESCIADVKGYAVRFGAGTAATGNAETYEIKNCSLKSACAEAGDAVIVLRGSADKSTLTITNTTIEGEIEITNNAQDATVIK
ncbi:MAG: SipW-dependent-type signal peptide-containing protein [Clostridia bacterium]|nr:SipW-dependent-type signal peptide-containing protein [Clostridia bacterium]